MPSDPDTSRTRQAVRRDILLLLAVAGFTVCMMFFYWLKAPRHVEPSLPKGGTSLHAPPRTFPQSGLAGTGTEPDSLGRAPGVACSVPANPGNAEYRVDHSSCLFLVALSGTHHESGHLIDDFLALNEHYGTLQGS